jgi:hypothetical protein
MTSCKVKRATAGVIATTSFSTKGAEELRNEIKHQMGSLVDYVDLQKGLDIRLAV